jgi:hypothetical protein
MPFLQILLSIYRNCKLTRIQFSHSFLCDIIYIIKNLDYVKFEEYYLLGILYRVV